MESRLAQTGQPDRDGPGEGIENVLVELGGHLALSLVKKTEVLAYAEFTRKIALPAYLDKKIAGAVEDSLASGGKPGLERVHPLGRRQPGRGSGAPGDTADESRTHGHSRKEDFPSPAMAGKTGAVLF